MKKDIRFYFRTPPARVIGRLTVLEYTPPPQVA